MKALVSVIIPTYKRPLNILMRAITSVLTQTYDKIEILVVDDSPPEFIDRDMVREHFLSTNIPKVTYIQHERNKGACAARNTGIENSKGEFLAFLDDDDEWLPNKLELQIPIFEFDDRIGLVYCKSYRQIGNNQLRKPKGKVLRGFCFQEILYRNFIGSTSFAVIKREVFNKCGGFNIEMSSAQDYEYWLRIAREFHVYGLIDPLGIYHIHNSERISSSPQKVILGLEKFNSLFFEDYKNNKKVRTRREIVLAQYYARRDGYFAGLKYAFPIYRRNPFSIYANMMMVRLISKTY